MYCHKQKIHYHRLQFSCPVSAMIESMVMLSMTANAATFTNSCCVQELDLDMLLMSIHDYFMGLGVDEIRRRGAEDDKPRRMVKTILHELCKLKVTQQYTPMPQCLAFNFVTRTHRIL